MTLEIMLLLALQSLYGYVYGIIGYAVGVLMAGLAAGAWLVQRRLTPLNAGKAILWSQVGLTGAAALSTLVLVGLQWFSVRAPALGVLPVAAVSVLMGLTGIAVGAAFPAAIVLSGRASGDVCGATSLYAIDLIGACTGAMLAGLVLVPLLGVPATCGLVMAMAAGAAVTCLTRPIRG